MSPQYCPPATLQPELGMQMPLSGSLTTGVSDPPSGVSRLVEAPESSVTLPPTDPLLWQPEVIASKAMHATGTTRWIVDSSILGFDMGSLQLL
jgi:hypothetical protein